ncbi:MAG: ATP-grasp domain-containing protein [Proteobacteria bacterium]|nr:ATP-grasp domain-containing protein [Pseudomonadota bacterium]MBU1715790.1 ATP-grasp domain-containing protein [Pseudomonadota bacterium]
MNPDRIEGFSVQKRIIIGQNDMSGLVKYGTVLVTGCGGDIGISIGRILRMSNVCEKLIGCDMLDNHPGAVFFDVCEKVPRADTDKYFEKLAGIAKKHAVDLIILVTEPELKVFHEKGYDRWWNDYPIVMANPQSLSIGLDKLATANFLKQHNLPAPWTVKVSSGPPPVLPCMIKDRFGAGSRSVSLVTGLKVAEELAQTRPDAIWQEYLYPEDEEYTCGLFRSETGEIRHITFRRKLQGGLTGNGELVENNEIATLLQQIALFLELTGSINVQLRCMPNGPFVFEINPRFSSTVMFRHLLGFQDLLWSLCESAKVSLPEYKKPTVGTRIYRCAQEVILPEPCFATK